MAEKKWFTLPLSFYFVVFMLRTTTHAAEDDVLLEWPSDTLKREGDNLMIKCKANNTDTVNLFFKRIGSSSGEIETRIFAAHNFHNDFKNRSSFDTKDEGYIFYIRNISLQDAGSWACKSDDGEGDRRSWELVVVAADHPLTEYRWQNYDGSQLVTYCLQYKGNKLLFLDCGTQRLYFQHDQGIKEEGCASRMVPLTSEIDNMISDMALSCTASLDSLADNNESLLIIGKSPPLYANRPTSNSSDTSRIQPTTDQFFSCQVSIGILSSFITALMLVVACFVCFPQRMASCVLELKAYHCWTSRESGGKKPDTLDTTAASLQEIKIEGKVSEVVESAVLHDIHCFLMYYSIYSVGHPGKLIETISLFIRHHYLDEQIEAANNLLKDKLGDAPSYETCSGIQKRELNRKNQLDTVASILMTFDEMESKAYRKVLKFTACDSKLMSIGMTKWLGHHKKPDDDTILSEERPSTPLSMEDPPNDEHKVPWSMQQALEI
jgi:hypothetical protein